MSGILGYLAVWGPRNVGLAEIGALRLGRGCPWQERELCDVVLLGYQGDAIRGTSYTCSDTNIVLVLL